MFTAAFVGPVVWQNPNGIEAVALCLSYFRHGLKVQEDEALQSNPRFWELIENARTASKG